MKGMTTEDKRMFSFKYKYILICNIVSVWKNLKCWWLVVKAVKRATLFLLNCSLS